MTIDYHALFNTWKTVTELAGDLLDPIETLEQQTAALKLLEVVCDTQQERPELGSLLGLPTHNIQRYKEDAFPDPVQPPGQILATLLEYQELSPAALARASGFSTEELDRLLTGQQDFSRTHMHTLAEHLHVNPEIFV